MIKRLRTLLLLLWFTMLLPYGCGAAEVVPRPVHVAMLTPLVISVLFWVATGRNLIEEWL